MILMYGNNATGIQHISSVTLTDKIEVCAFRFFVFRKGFSYGTDRINEIMRQKRFNLFDIVYSQSGFSQPSFDFVFVRLDGHLEKIFFGRNQS